MELPADAPEFHPRGYPADAPEFVPHGGNPYADSSGVDDYAMHAGMDMHGQMGGNPYGDMFGVADDDEFGSGIPIQQPVPDGPCVAVPALSLRQPFASLVLYGVKQLEARNRPALRGVVGPLAIHVSHKEEPHGSPLISTAVAILRHRFPDDAINSLFTLPPNVAQGHGCIVGLVDIEATWPADLFNEVEQSQLTEQAVFPVGGTFITQLRNPRWLKYPVRTAGSNKLWQVQLPVDALPDGTEVDANGSLVCTALRDKPPLYQPGSAAEGQLGDDMGIGLLGGDMVGLLGGDSRAGEKEKKAKKLQKALRQIDELKAKAAAGGSLEKTQQGKIEREAELRAELTALLEGDEGEAAPATGSGEAQPQPAGGLGFLG